MTPELICLYRVANFNVVPWALIKIDEIYYEIVVQSHQITVRSSLRYHPNQQLNRMMINRRPYTEQFIVQKSSDPVAQLDRIVADPVAFLVEITL